MGFRKPHPTNCFVQNNGCSGCVDGNLPNERGKQWPSGCRENADAPNAYRVPVTGTNDCNVRQRHCISWTNFCRSIWLCTLVLLLLNVDVIAAELQQNQYQQSTPCEARVLEELPPDPVSVQTAHITIYTCSTQFALLCASSCDSFSLFNFAFQYFRLEFDSHWRRRRKSYLHWARSSDLFIFTLETLSVKSAIYRMGIYSNESNARYVQWLQQQRQTRMQANFNFMRWHCIDAMNAIVSAAKPTDSRGSQVNHVPNNRITSGNWYWRQGGMHSVDDAFRGDVLLLF